MATKPSSPTDIDAVDLAIKVANAAALEFALPGTALHFTYYANNIGDAKYLESIGDKLRYARVQRDANRVTISAYPLSYAATAQTATTRYLGQVHRPIARLAFTTKTETIGTPQALIIYHSPPKPAPAA